MPILPQTVLAPLCQPFAKQADWILELYAMTCEPPRQPGKCLRCFYALLESASPEKAPSLEPLKQWIESHTVIGVRAGDQLRGTLPVQLQETSLDAFCSSAMEKVRGSVGQAPDATVFMELLFRSTAQAA